MKDTRDFVLTLTENEHNIVEYDILRPACEKLGIELTYKKFVPHIPMERYVRLHGDINAIEALTVFCGADKYKGQWVKRGNDVKSIEYPYLSLQTWHDSDTEQYEVRMYDSRILDRYPKLEPSLVRNRRFWSSNADDDCQKAEDLCDELLEEWSK
jgi:hypothetical protein